MKCIHIPNEMMFFCTIYGVQFFDFSVKWMYTFYLHSEVYCSHKHFMNLYEMKQCKTIEFFLK